MVLDHHFLLLDPKTKAFSFCEFFAGTASCSRAIRAADYPTAALDIEYFTPREGKQNPYDILTPSGMAFLDFS